MNIFDDYFRIFMKNITDKNFSLPEIYTLQSVMGLEFRSKGAEFIDEECSQNFVLHEYFQ